MELIQKKLTHLKTLMSIHISPKKIRGKQYVLLFLAYDPSFDRNYSHKYTRTQTYMHSDWKDSKCAREVANKSL